MADNISSGTNVLDADFSNDLFSDAYFSHGFTHFMNDLFSDGGFPYDIFSDAGFSNDLSSCQPRLEALQNLSDQQNLREASPSKLDREWGHIYGSTSGDRHGNYGGSSGMYSSSECWSVGSEAQSQTSVQRFQPGNTYYDQGKAKDRSTGKSILRPRDKNVTRNIPPFSSKNYEADESPSLLVNDDMQSDSTINLKDETCEMNLQVPQLGMVFSSEEEAYKFYKNYATKMGFRVRRGKTQRLTDGTIRKRYIYCSAQGFRSENKSGKARKYRRKETRIGCDAMVQFTHDKDSGKWEITCIVLEHKHDTNAPNQRHNACPSPNSLKEDAIVTPISKAGMMEGTGVANSPESFPCVNHSNSYLSNEKTNILPPEHSQSLVNFADHLQWEDPTADQSQGQSSSFSCRLVLKALKVITRSEALEGSHKIVEKYLDMALEEVENVSKVKMTGHIDGNDAEIHKKNGGSNGIDCMETQWKVPNPPCSSKKESCDDAIIHCRPLREERKGPRARSGSPDWIGETSRQQPCNPAEIIMRERVGRQRFQRRRVERERIADIQHGLTKASDIFDRDDGLVPITELESLLIRLGAKPPTLEEVSLMLSEMDSAGDGCISLEALSRMVGSACEPTSDHHLMGVFDFFDTDHDGNLTAEDLLRAFTELGDPHCTLDDCQRMIALVGKEGDGFVCFEDFLKMMCADENKSKVI